MCSVVPVSEEERGECFLDWSAVVWAVRMVFFNTAGENSVILLVLLCVGASKQQQVASRCDYPQTVFFHGPCISCAAALSARCPPGQTLSNPLSPVTPQTFPCRYVVKLGRTELELRGCRRICQKSVVRQQCCPGHWGPLCLPCPSWSGKKCNFRGACLDGGKGNGTCLCDEGFSGFACHECQSPLAYGPNCDRVCDCVNGVCSKGPDGTGECLCQPPYSGPRCNQVSDQCRNCSSFSYCGGAGQQAGCVCLPGHRKSATLNTCMSSCSARDCHPDADCSTVGSKVQCVCKAGYHGDGKICLPINPCSVNNGDCPPNSTVCVFKGPNKSSCECMLGMAPLGSSSPKAGCVLASACSLDTCDSTAFCVTERNGIPSCECAAGRIGDGWRCYGNLMERVLELDQKGDQRGKLSGTIILFEGGCQLALSQEGPFTAFIPLMDKPPSEEVQKEFCRKHLMLGQHLLKNLEGQRDVNFFGGEKVRFKGNKRFILTEDPLSVYTVVQANLPAANGIIHIIDRPIGSPVPGSPHDQMFSDRTIGEILRLDQKFNRFLSLLDNCGATLPLSGPGPLTVFIPTNEAVDNARDGSLMYMITNAKHKLQELLKYHMYSHAALSTGELASLPQIETLANQIITITVGNDGKVLLGEKSVPLVTSNIVASNGIVHMIEGLLVPPSILPIMPHRCDVISSRISMGPCIHCNALHASRCPDGSTELTSHQTGCNYRWISVTLSDGCAKFCNSSTQVAGCCPGFYGPDCRPCIGGFQTPCYGRGRCSDGIHGNGACSCHSAFTGVACHICSDPNKHGDNCDQDCLCVHGVCDNRADSGGACRPGCSEGFAGPLCDQTIGPCRADGLHRHCHMNAYCLQSGAGPTCVCKEGFEGDGLSCTLVNPCLRNRGGCDANAHCVFASTPNVSCVCNVGWSGDGLVCVEINNCDLASRGGCSPDADCIYIGPEQSECKCKSGFQEDGDTCERIDPCRKNNGGCHKTAKCSLSEDQTNCTCPPELHGDGLACYGSLLEELDSNWYLNGFNRWLQRDKASVDYLSQNVTVFAPSRDVWKNFSSTQEAFWFNRHRITHFLQAQMIPGLWTVEDLKGLEGHSVPTLGAPTSWIISSSNGTLLVGNASIHTANLPSTNGYIHIINGLLAPPLSDLSPYPPTLMGFLNSSSNFTLFRYYVLLYKLEEGKNDFTLLLPTDDAVRRHLSSTNSTLLDPSVFRYHFLNEILLPADLRDGLVKETLLGEDYSLQFHLKNNQTLVNDAVIDSGYVDTKFGVVMFLNQVLKVQQNRCSRSVNLRSKGRCSSCEGPPRCFFTYKPTMTKFPDGMVPDCFYRKRVGPRRRNTPGCKATCFKVQKDHACCPGYYGHECYRCPGEAGDGCSGHGRCQDGLFGDGECRCYEGFHGTACEDCEPGRYGTNCSSKCVCDHGKCEDGLAGSGRCLCFKGWRGTSCSVEIKDDVCGGICDENANCIAGPLGSSPTCVCAAGYHGNGTSCKELDLCGWENGGCSRFAVCARVSPTQRTCNCKDGYFGDGVVCLEVDGCLFNNGGCDRTAECTRTGPNTTACSCQPGSYLLGRRCSKVMQCSRGKCVCSPSAIRMGACKGSTLEELKYNPKNAFFRQMMNTYYPLSQTFKGPITVFVPDIATNQDFPLSEWQSQGRTQHLSQAHVVSCEVLSFSDLTTTQQAVSLSGHTLDFTQRQGDLYVNNRSRIIGSDVTADGIIHYVDQVLTPYSLENKSTLGQKMNFSTAVKAYGYSRFSDLFKDSGLLPVLSMTRLQPFRMLWPTDEALQRLPEARRTWLSAPQHKQQLKDILQAHILRSSMIQLVTEARSMHGSKISFTCNKDLAGDLTVNGARVVERFMVFKEGVAFGIDQLLEPPGLGAHCDGLENETITSRCGFCSAIPSCPYQSKDTGESKMCTSTLRHKYRSVPMSHSFRRGGLMDSFPFVLCTRICRKEVWKAKCCPGHFGSDCQVCPGGLTAPCGNHGECRDGIYGRGTCTCSKGFRGSACERCEPRRHGNNCTECQCVHGRCDDGIDGSGECSCEAGWYGKLCKEKLDQLPEECAHCHEEAACVPGSGCQCRNHFEGNGTHCSPMPVPDLCAEYNGGCHQHADCNQTSWQTNCSCQAGYQGDGYSCEPINRCIEELNGGCSDFSDCKFTGPGQRQCECKLGYVGNGVQCLERVVPPVDRCLEENGGCHAQASCKDLHYHARTAGVFYLPSPQGIRYQMNLTGAQNGCSQQGATLASFKQLADAQQLGMHLCIAGWLEGGKVGYPTTVASPRCGDGHVGVVLYKEPVPPSSKYDAYCYRETDVSCVCNSGYVGDGGFCNGAVINVLAMNTDFSRFYKFILDYSGLSVKGRELLDFLSSAGSDVMLFVPHNDGFLTNQTLSGRDLEYHVSANHSRRLYQDLQHQEEVRTWLGANLIVTHGNNQSDKLVNQQLLLDWDVPATNGIIHVIQAPLRAPPPQAKATSSQSPAPSSGVSAILVALLLCGLGMGAVGYFLWRRQKTPFNFQYFKNETEAVPAAMMSIDNPLYSENTDSGQPSDLVDSSYWGDMKQ
ncbi:stabilin-1 isoform X1 [Gadus chalcogrammus]|uniref:stabilin-1 isoform X1 n=1 Tax=Gadus chalcogrammus TaxID=1042646 RepID=UPI0024C47607|nr:stabilin-1 isoform X1 [Gadus chalcogrammus]